MAILRRIALAFNLKDNFLDIFIRRSGRFEAIDGLRALSVLYVMLFHSAAAVVMSAPGNMKTILEQTGVSNQWVLMGDRGVDSFFVISGFLIAQLLFVEQIKNKRINLGRFFYRRWLRLTPIYFFLLILVYLFATPNVEKQYLWAYAFYVNNFLDEAHRYIPYAWSLAVEEQFYIVFSLFCALCLFRVPYRLTLLLCLYLASIVIRALILLSQPELLVTGDVLLYGHVEITEAYNQALYINLHSRFGAVMTGVVLAYLYVFHKVALRAVLTTWRSNSLLLVALCLLLISSTLPIYYGGDLPTWVLFSYPTAHRHVFALAIGIMLWLCLYPQGLSIYLHRFFGRKILLPYLTVILFHQFISFAGFSFTGRGFSSPRYY